MNDSNLSIIIVDDEVSIRNGLKNSINWDDLDITVVGTAANGLEALVLIEKYSPDIVLTDIRMPECDGLSLIAKAKELHFTCEFIIFSGFDDFKYAQQAMRYGVISYLLKPIKIDSIINEIQILSSKIRSMQEENLTKTVAKHSMRMGIAALRDQFFQALIQNEYHTDAEIWNHIERCHLNITNSSFNVFAFAYGGSYIGDNIVFSKEDSLLLKSSVRNIIEELLIPNNSATFVDANDYIIVLIQTPYANSHPEDFPKRFCEKCIHAIFDFCNIPMWAGIGMEVDKLLNIYQSYGTALECLSYRLYDTKQKVFSHHEIANAHQQPPSTYASTINNQNIIDAIYRGNIEDMREHTNIFFSSLFYIEFPPPSFVRGMCTYLIIDVQNGLSNYLTVGQKFLDEKPYGKLIKISSFQQMKTWIINLFTEYISYIQIENTLQKDLPIEKAKYYIDSHIYQKITVENVASYIHLSEKYFTNYFKEKTNQSFKNYVLTLKIEKAKEMLRTGEKSISEISVLLGYTDYRGFNRIFKKHTNKTPSEYQELYRKNLGNKQ